MLVLLAMRVRICKYVCVCVCVCVAQYVDDTYAVGKQL